MRATGATRLELATPYLHDVQARIVANYAAKGFDCVAERHLNEPGNFSFSEVKAEQITAMVREVAAAKPDSITTSCANLRGASLVAGLEAELGIPINDTIAVVVWKSLLMAGLGTDRVVGWGWLFAQQQLLPTMLAGNRPCRQRRPSYHSAMCSDRADEFADLKKAALAYGSRHRVLAELPWPDGHRMAVNFTADFDAMLLRRLLNEPPMQLAKGEFGGRVGIWRLLELFESHAIKATIFTPGRICELYPAAVKAAARGGHEVADHMWEHRVPKEPAVERAHLSRAADALERLTGKRPVGTRSWHTSALLQEFGFLYNSHETPDHRPHYILDETGTGELLNLPFHYAIDDAMFFNFAWLNTENDAQRMADPDRVFEIWWDAFRQQYGQGGYLNICLHPFDSGRALRIAMLDRLITRMKTLPGVWFPTCEEVARHCLSVAPPRSVVPTA